MKYKNIIFVGLSILFISCAPSRPSDEQLQSFQEAKRFYVEGNWSQTAKLLGGKDWGNLPQARLLLGRSLFLTDQYPAAKEVLSRLSLDYPAYTEAGLWLARVLMASQELDQAAQVIENQLDWSAEDSRLLYLLGALHEARGDLDKALGAYERSISLSEDMAKSYLALAKAYYRYGIQDRAQQYLALADSLLPLGSPLKGALKRALENIQFVEALP